jgi:HEAT repeat protein
MVFSIDLRLFPVPVPVPVPAGPFRERERERGRFEPREMPIRGPLAQGASAAIVRPMFRPPLLPRTLEAAHRDLASDKPSVRADAARDLAKHADDARDEVLRGLTTALSDRDASVRAAAATALADIEGKEALDALIAAVGDDDAMVRQMALTALGEIGDPRAEPRVKKALSDSMAEARFQAVIAYPRLAGSRAAAMEALLHATRDEDDLVCHIALRVAEELGREGGEIDERVMVRARALSTHGSPQVRVLSAILLAPRGDAKAKDVLVQTARGELKTRDREDEATAVELVGELGLDAARAGLERRAFGGLLGLFRDPLAWHARVALARMGHERASREILRELGAPDRDVRTLAVAAAGRARLVAAKPRIAAMRGDEARADPHAVDEALETLTAAEAEALAS